MPVYWDKEREQWCYSFNRIIKGVRYRSRERLPKAWKEVRDRAKAEKYGREKDAELFELATGVVQREELISDALAEYLSKKTFRDKEGTVVGQIALMLPYISGKTISQFPEVVKEYLDDNEDHSPATKRNRIGYIRAGLRWCWKHQIIKTPVPPVVIPVVANQRHFYLKVEEQQILLDHVEPIEARAIFTLAFWTGCRWESEILPLGRDGVITNGEDVFIDLGVTKNGRRKRKYVREEARWCLAYIPWTHSRTWFYERFRSARSKAGLEGYRIHDMRHSLASEIISNGGTLSDVGAVLGHESHQSSARYAHLYPERQMEVLKKVGKK